MSKCKFAKGNHPFWPTGTDWGGVEPGSPGVGQRRGALVAYRIYSQRDLQLDVNLLTSEFPATLADALDRVLTMPKVLAPAAQGDTRFPAANL